MNDKYDVSVVVSTYNRCASLARLLETLMAQQSGNVSYEVIIVDNNSTDRTREVVESFMAKGQPKLQYVFEKRQGVSYGRNAGIARAVAPIIAFTDDDMLALPDWVAQLKRAFDEHPDADFVGGKVEPQWSQTPPSWLLNRRHWMPLGIALSGDEPFYSNLQNRKDFPTCNIGFRREFFEQVGLFAPEVQRVKDSIGSFEDYEICLRAWQAGRQGVYIPTVKMLADVQPERLEKEYHRLWYDNNGKFAARFRHQRLSRIYGPDGKPTGKAMVELRFFGAPISTYLNLLIYSLRLLLSLLGRREEAFRFFHQLRVLNLKSTIRESYRLYAAERNHSHIAEVRNFLKALIKNRGRMFEQVGPSTGS